MAAIPSEIYGRLRQTLLECGAAQKRAVFADDRLAPWRYDLPYSGSPSSYVDAVLSHLLTRQHSQYQRNALVLYLEVLSEEFDSGDACHQKLRVLAHDLQAALGIEPEAEVTKQLGERSRLLNLITEHFNLEELKTLCFDLDVDYEGLAGDTKVAKARELIQYADRNRRLEDLIERLAEMRPKVSWNFDFS